MNYDIVVDAALLYSDSVLNLANEDENNSYSIYLPHDILKIPNCNYIQGLLVVVLRQLFIKIKKSTGSKICIPESTVSKKIVPGI